MTQHPPVHHPKNPVLGFHGLDETVPQGSVYLVSSFFFAPSHFFPGPFFSSPHFFFGPTILEPNFVSVNSYLLLQPTSLPAPNPSTSLPPSHLCSLLPVLFLPSPSQEELRRRARGATELRSNAGGEGKLLPFLLFFEMFLKEEEDDNDTIVVVVFFLL